MREQRRLKAQLFLSAVEERIAGHDRQEEE